MRILVALSGGIDSSVVAHLLKEQGHEIIGVRFTLWTDPLAPPLAEVLPSKCCNAQTAYRAKKVAEDLDIDLHILDLEDAFKEEVVDPFLEGYASGNTPNPCIRCNRTMKFGRLLTLADELGCEKLATGHYARTATESFDYAQDDTPTKNRTLLLEALDSSKDQSYYLYGLMQEQLSRVLFPLGGMQKQDVFSLAEHFKIPYEESSYRESQDLCFFPEKTPTEFLKRHLQDSITPGPITRKDGTVVGTHKGLPLYTIGQRRGLGIGGLSIPLEVTAKDPSTNTLIVNEQGAERSKTMNLSDVSWVSWQPKEGTPTTFECRTRSLGKRLSGEMRYTGSNGTFSFAEPQPLGAVGQSLVLYRGEEVVGGGVIA